MLNNLSNQTISLEQAGGWDPRLEPLAALLDAGGPVILILLALSVFTVALITVKLYQFRIARVGERRPTRRALELYRQGRVTDALTVLEGARGPLAEILGLTLRARLGDRYDPEPIREEAMRLAVDRLEVLRSHLRSLEVIASLAPLLGLFGTVLGIIEAFRQMEAAGSQVDPSVLSGGIWEALLTTAFGLALAIPAVAVLNAFERVLERLAHDLQDGISQIFTADLRRFAPPASESSDLPSVCATHAFASSPSAS
ncbi:MAG: MotA/TolQ/ExbB proton channel family protein [Gammaproteobacteria bacterium]